MKKVNLALALMATQGGPIHPPQHLRWSYACSSLRRPIFVVPALRS
jgi:hypothetical protein